MNFYKYLLYVLFKSMISIFDWDACRILENDFQKGVMGLEK
jgi:hypothetical protein